MKILLFFASGVILGSILNSLIYRFYYNLPVLSPSKCPDCGAKLKVKDQVPLLSFIFLLAKCRYCRKKISWQYFLVELSAGILFAAFFIKYGAINLLLIRDLFFTLVLIFIFVFDLKYFLILDKIIWPAAVISLALNLCLGILWWNLLLGISIAVSLYLVQYVFSRGKGLGLGDVKFGFLIGAMLGFKLTIMAIITAYLIGGIVAAILLILRKKKLGDILPMGTFLSLAAIIVLLIGESLLKCFFKVII